MSGPWSDEGQPLQTMYGTVQMVMENGEWKVDELNWSNERPAILATPKPAAAPATAGAKTAPAASAPVAPPTPTRTLGAAKPPCVYKPVMTAEDVENCK